ncbi:M16 family metallopeptidase [Paludibacter jiangxiensis]|uniref:Predicted Zn-dependent peptidase n=1 Tax=Paludibacter jiangxiensis TaxID=681398 RepID=A0A161LV48_9BACT|nr:pitrilysin family protein [Paludibacter jiangxiensis]GAT63039.1 predicted Zn-dependent peptidase [Paludibacter jiangxiensis]
MQYLTHTLSNGLRIVHKPDPSPVSYCGLAINVGTRDELPHEHGMAHFIEHLIFKGTSHRKSWHIITSMEEVGGELNAYTTKEETFLYSVFLERYFEKAIGLVSDMAANSIFPEKETIKETDIVLDEIESYNDSPSDLIFDEIEEILFDEYAIGRNILGSVDSLKNFTHKDIVEFHHRNYTADRMVFFSLGNTDFKKIVRLAEKHLSGIPAGSAPLIRQLPELYKPQSKKANRDTHQTHYILGNRAYTLHHPDRIALHLLNNILGGPGMNSMLNLSLRERSGLVYNVESNFAPYTDTGALTIYFGSDPKNMNRCARLIEKELSRLREAPLTSNFVEKAKKQLLGQMTIATESKENLALSLGRSILHFNRFDSIEESAEKLKLITPEKLQQIAQEVFAPELLSKLIYTE